MKIFHAEKVITMLSDRDKREKMGMAEYSKSLLRHRWDRVIDRVQALYRDLHAVKISTKVESAIYEDALRGSQV
jgi:hypothetical protein